MSAFNQRSTWQKEETNKISASFCTKSCPKDVFVYLHVCIVYETYFVENKSLENNCSANTLLDEGINVFRIRIAFSLYVDLEKRISSG